MTGRTAITGLTKEELESQIIELGQPKYRAGQVMEWIYSKRVKSFSEMTNLPEGFRSDLDTKYVINPLTPVKDDRSSDTTRKYLYQLKDGRYIETVIIPASIGQHGKRSDRNTLCVSSQVGCAYGCKFCASGLDGFARNLEAAEITGQILAVEEETMKKINNVVFMGMGEPLANYDRTWAAVRRLHGDLGLSARHLTISTVGVVPGIRRMATEGLPVNLAVSLHAADDGLRDELVPLNRRYPLAELADACQAHVTATGRRLSFEWALIHNVNDRLEDAARLADYARPLGAHVNLIPLNPTPGWPTRGSPPSRVREFADEVNARGGNATIRRTRGTEIDAACGQLRAERANADSVNADRSVPVAAPGRRGNPTPGGNGSSR